MKKNIIRVLIILFLVTTCMAFVSYGATTQTPIYLGLSELRTISTPNFGYSIGDPNSSAESGTAVKLWNIVKYSTATSNDPTEGNIYCLKAGVGFTDTTQNATYNIFYDMKTEKEQIKAQNDVLAELVEGTQIELDDGSTVDRYNAVLALLDMLYYYGESNEGDKTELLNSAGIYEEDWDDILTEDEIKAIQQAAIWYFTNYGEENGKYDKTGNTGWLYYMEEGGTYKNLADYNPTNVSANNSIGIQRQEQAEMLYNYLIKTAKNNAKNYTDTSEPPAQVDTTALDYTVDGSNYIIGPIHITQNNDIPYEINFQVQQLGIDITDYQILNADKEQVSSQTTVKDLVGEDFYISIPIGEYIQMVPNGKGDIDGNGTIDEDDLTLGLNHVSKKSELTEEQQKRADVNEDGTIDLKDLMLLVKYLQNGEEVVIKIDINYSKTNLTLWTSTNNNGEQPVVIPEKETISVPVSLTVTTEVTRVTVNKEWEDNNNQDGIRATEVEVALVKNGVETATTLTLNAANNWTAIFENLPLKENGTEITYSVVEKTTLNGYTTATTRNSTNNYTITNTHTPEVTSVTVNKEWIDNNNQDGIRATEVEVALVKNGTETSTTVTLNAANNWTATFENLPLKENGTEITYSVVEKTTLNGYTSNTTKNSDNNYTITNTHTIEKTFDLALRKYITSVNGEELTEESSRVPNIDESTLEAGTTATYKHKKAPVVVKAGDKVIYKITIYNEGEKEGRATKIVDQLPTGLKFSQVISGNFVLDSYSEEDNTLNLKRVEGNTDNLPAYETNDLSSETIEIECEVTQIAGATDKVLTNVAWISEEVDGETNEVITNQVNKDIDSEPANTPDVDKDSMEEYKGNTENKDDLTDSDYYYKGEQDDDDFEKLIIKKAEGTYNLQIIKVDEVDVTKKLSGAEFEVLLADGSTQTVTTNDQGIIEINGIVITEEGTDTITIKEITAPVDYEKLIDTLTLEITKTIVDGNYMATAAILTNENTSGETVSAENGIITVTVPNREILKPIDLKLIKRITAVNNQNVPERIESVDVSKLNTLDENGKLITTGEYTLSKEPVGVKKGDIVTYTFRIYNEGMIDGYAQEITEDIPEGLEFLWSDKEEDELAADETLTDDEKTAIEFNQKYLWGNFVYDETNEKIIQISSDYLSKENETTVGGNLISAFGENDGTKTEADISYKEVSVMLKVTADNISGDVIRNEACISEDADANGYPADDRDSDTEEWMKENSEKYYDEDEEWPIYKEDDEDYDNIILQSFDLALRKFIVAVSKDTTIEDTEYLKNEDGTYTRAPVVDTSKLNTVDENGKLITTATYNHTKEPILVQQNDIVVYMLRVYNEGEIDGYAAEIKDHLPEYLEFVEGEFNEEYGWSVSEDGRTVTTRYLENSLINKATTDQEEKIVLTYKEVPIMCKVVESAPTSQNITNIADITEYQDDNKNEVTDRDSQSDNVELPSDENLPSYKDDETGSYVPGQQDDDDFEKVIVKTFDLALRKWVTQAIVIENGEQSITNTGHQPYDDPEQVVKVELHRKKLNQVTVKFKYSIRVINEGEIAGYAKEVTDYVPEGLKFVLDDNPGWADEGNNVISTKLLENTLLQPGEYADIEVTLTWINNQDNMGVMTNTAEISEDYNEYGVPDKDSTPDNKKQGEDDIDDAPVMLSISTGQMRIYFTLGFIVLITIAGGVVLIKKYIL